MAPGSSYYGAGKLTSRCHLDELYETWKKPSFKITAPVIPPGVRRAHG